MAYKNHVVLTVKEWRAHFLGEKVGVHERTWLFNTGADYMGVVKYGQRLSADAIKEIVTSPETTSELAERLDLHPHTIRRCRHEHGVSRPKGRPRVSQTKPD